MCRIVEELGIAIQTVNEIKQDKELKHANLNFPENLYYSFMNTAKTTGGFSVVKEHKKNG